MSILSEIIESWSDDHEAAGRLATLEAKVGSETTYDELSELLDWDYAAVRDDMKLLSRLGVVDAIKGSRGHKSRVKWLRTPTQVAHIVKGGPVAGLLPDEVIAQQPNADAGRTSWCWHKDVLPMLAARGGVPVDEIVVDIKVGPLKRNLARLHEIDERDVDVRIGV